MLKLPNPTSLRPLGFQKHVCRIRLTTDKDSQLEAAGSSRIPIAKETPLEPEAMLQFGHEVFCRRDVCALQMQ